jgi:hypothetical protein
MIATAKDVRAWAREVGLKVGTRGHLPGYIWAAYLEQHPEASN